MRCNRLSPSIRGMILRIRPYLMIFLVLLQFAAPLIHAHAKSVTQFSASIHLPEFEQINVSPKHAPEFRPQTHHNEGLITLSSGIQNEITSFFQIENTVFILLLSLIFIAKKQHQPLCFSRQTEPILRPFFLNFTAPRAPPFFTFF